MDTKVSDLPTHYEVLGVEPTASENEIARAFTRKMGIFGAHDLASLARANIAFKTLRDPKLRQAYDASIAPKPEPRPEAQAWVSLGGPKHDVSLLETSWAELMRPVGGATPSAQARRPEPRPDPVGEPATGAFIASSLRQPAAPVIAKTKDKTPEPAPAPEVATPEEPATAPPPAMTLEASEVSAGEWKRTGMLVGAPLAAVVLTAGIAGWWSAREIGEPAAAVPSETVALPPAQPSMVATDEPSAALTEAPAVARTEPAITRAAPVRRTVISSPPPQTLSPAATEEPKPPAIAAAEPQQLVPSEADEPFVDVSRLQAARAASMPLPNRVIARTIHRIGYSCGEVASTTAVEGSPGVFKVSCTSGQAYQARPVGGRYHFRRWGKE